jgi:hypothetical protein
MTRKEEQPEKSSCLIPLSVKIKDPLLPTHGVIHGIQNNKLGKHEKSDHGNLARISSHWSSDSRDTEQ